MLKNSEVVSLNESSSVDSMYRAVRVAIRNINALRWNYVLLFLLETMTHAKLMLMNICDVKITLRLLPV